MILSPGIQAEISLLDLPDLALERIAAHLQPADLASCMMCCTTLRALLRRQQSAMVHARSLGRKWVLRACGRALFADVAAWYHDGVVNFEFPAGLAHDLESKLEVGRCAAQNYQGHIQKCAKTIADTRYPPNERPPRPPMSPGSFFYLYRLAESRGFNTVLRILERVWRQAVSVPGLQGAEVDLEKAFQTVRASEKPIFRFKPSENFADSSFYPGPVQESDLGVGDPDSRAVLIRSLSKAAASLLGPEVLAVMFYVYLLKYVFHPQLRVCGPIRELFKGVLELVQ